MQEEEKEQDFGIPDDSAMYQGQGPKLGVESSDGSASVQDVINVIKFASKKAPRTKSKGKFKGKSKDDLTPLLNALTVEIEDIMDLLILVRGTDQKTDILCRKVGASLMRMQDIVDRLMEE